MIKKGDKKMINAWVFYDWANSVYNLVISSAIFPIFYDTVTEKHFALTKLGMTEKEYSNLPEDYDFGKVTIDFFGFELGTATLMSFVLCASFIVVSILSPLLSGVADYSGSKKKFMQFFCYLGAVSCVSLYWFNPAWIELSMISIFLASIGFWNSLVFYNAYLPEIAEPKDHDRISARGFSMGYFGSMILLVICLAIIMLIDASLTSLSFVLVGIWWVGFAQITFRKLPKNVYGKKPEKGVLMKGFRELKQVFKQFRKTRRLKTFLYSFFFFNAGVQTVMLMAALFASQEIEWNTFGKAGLIIAILIIQILGAAGAFIMSRLSGRLGNLVSLRIVVVLWVVMCVIAYFITTEYEFFALAAGVGLVMGGVQALSRSTYSKFLPETQDHASYFSFYDATEKIGIVVGLFFFGLMELLTGDLRSSVLSLIALFSIGFILLIFVPRREKQIAGMEFDTGNSETDAIDSSDDLIDD